MNGLWVEIFVIYAIQNNLKLNIKIMDQKEQLIKLRQEFEKINYEMSKSAFMKGYELGYQKRSKGKVEDLGNHIKKIVDNELDILGMELQKQYQKRKKKAEEINRANNIIQLIKPHIKIFKP